MILQKLHFKVQICDVHKKIADCMVLHICRLIIKDLKGKVKGQPEDSPITVLRVPLPRGETSLCEGDSMLVLFCLNLATSTNLKLSLGTQPSPPLWYCTIRGKSPLFLFGISTSAWKPRLYSAAIMGFICSRSLWTRYRPCAGATAAKFLCHVISSSSAPATVCLFLGLWSTEESLLDFLRDVYCLLNNSV